MAKDKVTPVLMWASIETWIIIIVSCLPSIKSIVERILRTLHILPTTTLPESTVDGEFMSPLPHSYPHPHSRSSRSRKSRSHSQSHFDIHPYTYPPVGNGRGGRSHPMLGLGILDSINLDGISLSSSDERSERNLDQSEDGTTGKDKDDKGKTAAGVVVTTDFMLCEQQGQGTTEAAVRDDTASNNRSMHTGDESGDSVV